jgi:hypothetical protein
MKINLNAIDREQFMVHPHVVNGETLWLVQPQHIGCKWTQANKHLRSSVWNDEGELVSAGFPKFVNWGENPDNFPLPTSLKDTTIVEKIDGSLLIVSKYKGNHIIRTRGTVDASKLDNGHELELFKEKMFPLIDGFENSWEFSILFEWVSPNQRIILNYGDQPEWYLVGIVHHSDYSLETQPELDQWAHQHGLKRPPAYSFPSVENLMKDVEAWKGKEGVVVYSGNGQMLHKVKGLWYLALHRMKEALSSFDKVVDVWYEQGQPSYQDFEKFIASQFDWELWTQCRGDASRICDGSKMVDKIILGMNVFVDQVLKHLPTRKDQAIKVLSSYGNTNRASFVFKLLDGKTLEVDDRKKLLYQVLKK